MRRFAFLAWLLVVAASACSSGPPPREYEIVGQIQALAPERSEVTIKHQDIKNFMPGMTMAFKVKDAGLLEGKQPGDLVTGTLVVGEVEVHISALTRTGHTDLDTSTVQLPSDGSSILQPGDAVQDAVLLDQDGATRRLSEWRGHRLALTFIYTRCPLPEFCPLMNRHFLAVQTQLSSDPSLGDVRLLTMSLDPAFDTPQVLKPYAGALGADPGRWTFLTGAPEAAGAFAAQFGLIVEHDPTDAVQITHNLRTVVIGTDGRLAAIHTGNHWTPDELVADLKATPAPAR